MPLTPGTRLAVFAIRTMPKTGETLWVRAGVAYVQPDDSINITLDVLPIEGKLHIRETKAPGSTGPLGNQE